MSEPMTSAMSPPNMLPSRAPRAAKHGITMRQAQQAQPAEWSDRTDLIEIMKPRPTTTTISVVLVVFLVTLNRHLHLLRWLLGVLTAAVHLSLLLMLRLGVWVSIDRL